MMKKISQTFAVSIMMFSHMALASVDMEAGIKIVNHFPIPLRFLVRTINYRNPSSIPMKFTLKSGEAISGSILHVGSDGRPRQDVYFNVYGISDNDTPPDYLSSAFWGVYYNIVGHHLEFNKYDVSPYQEGLAYSWVRDSGASSSTITFCSEEEFNKHQHC